VNFQWNKATFACGDASSANIDAEKKIKEKKGKKSLVESFVWGV
jgi:hypothetical protein